jgi:oligopeptide transport system ATP-binding protein
MQQPNEMTQESIGQPSPIPAAEVVRVENLRVHFTLREGQLRRREMGTVRAVDGVSFSVRQGELLALVGAPECGKTTVARAVGLLERPTAGRIIFQGRELTSLRGQRLKHARREVQILFSNPYTAFAPRMTVEDILAEALALGGRRSEQEQDERLTHLMAQAGLNLYFSVRYPRDLSGGIRQRLALARALAVEPTLLICDQPADFVGPATADRFVDLLHRLRSQLDLTLLLTARRLRTARHADRVAVMVLGRIVEMAHYADLVRRPLHPFTQRLLQPSIGGVPDQSLDPLRRSPGCHFAPLCPLAEAQCQVTYPPFVEGAPNHGVACHLVDPVTAGDVDRKDAT